MIIMTQIPGVVSISENLLYTFTVAEKEGAWGVTGNVNCSESKECLTKDDLVTSGA